MRQVPPKGRVKTKSSRSKLIEEADKAFRDFIVKRDRKCLNPDSNHHGVLTCSHYFGRSAKYTRWDENNCITLCWWHHFKSKDYGWEYQKQRQEKHGWDGRYTLFMKNHLGREGFSELDFNSKKIFREKDDFISTIIATFTAKLHDL